MLRMTTDEYFMAMLELVAARSTCARRSVGAIITTAKGHILATGYNGVPSGFAHCTEVPCHGSGDAPGDTSRCLAIHAEQNALLQCYRLDLARVLYVTCCPCFACAKLIANTPIRSVFCAEPYSEQGGLAVLHDAGIQVRCRL